MPEGRHVLVTVHSWMTMKAADLYHGVDAHHGKALTDHASSTESAPQMGLQVCSCLPADPPPCTALSSSGVGFTDIPAAWHIAYAPTQKKFSFRNFVLRGHQWGRQALTC